MYPFRFCLFAVALAAWFLVRPPLARAQTPTTGALVAREIAVLKLAGGGTPLTLDERRQAAQAVQSALATNRAALLKSYAELTKPLKRAAHDRAYAAYLRLLIRYADETAQLPPGTGLDQTVAIEQQIIHAHDPTVVVDTKRQLIITEKSLRDFLTASQWLARKYHLPPPSDHFTAHLRDWFLANYVSSDDATAVALALQGVTFPYVAPVIAEANPARKQATFQQIRQQLQAADPAARDLLLAGTITALGALCAKKAEEKARFAWVDDNPYLSQESKDTLKWWLSQGWSEYVTATTIANM
ncbi:hypothetical protein [Candidatus Methylocalor cossyra]|uniref:Uncharacterized protein n=1 Tax=Candidatus Methylocalor cossyra TaxID=3108543 RepID=A0ABP1CD01_9GAMM